nr:hypothetical protein [Dyadobacter psychrotolerans]
MKRIECPPVIFHLWRSQVKCQHHFVFRNRKIQRLLNSLGLHPHPPKDADHLVSITRITAKPVPFGKKNQIHFPF